MGLINMYEDIYSAYHVGIKPPVLKANQVKPALKELKGYGLSKRDRKAAVVNALEVKK